MTDLASHALSLRCRTAEWIDRAESFAEFRRPAAAPPLHRELGLAELLITDHAARRWSGLERLGLPALTCETTRFGIVEALGHEREATPLEHWEDHGEVVGDLVAEPSSPVEPDMLGVRMRRGLVALAAALPMLTSTLAEAAPPAPAPSLREAGTGTAGVEGPAPTTSAAPSTTTPAPEPTPAPSPTPTSAPTVEAPPVVVAPSVAPADSSLSLSGRRLWKGLIDQPLVLRLKDGTELPGLVVAQSSNDLAFARASDGTIVAVPKAEVVGVQLRGSAPRNVVVPQGPGSGTGLMIGGGVMLAAGSAFALAGTIGLSVYASYFYIHLPLLVTGLAMVGGGIAMHAVGNKRAKKAQRGGRAAKLQWAPTMGANRQGGQAGLILRF